MPIIAIIAIILSALIFIFSKKIKSNLIKTISLIIIILLVLISYHVIPYIYTAKAILADKKQEVIENYDNAIKTAIFPIHKGLILLEYANTLTLYKEPHDAKLKYEKAYS